MRIRLATIEDLESLRAMASEFLKEEDEGGSPIKPGERSLAWLLRICALIVVGKTEGAVLIAEEGELPAGFTLFYVEPLGVDHRYEKVGRSLANYVRPEHRRTGLASDLIEAKEVRAKRMGCEAMYTQVRISNEPSLGLVRKAGYAADVVSFAKEL